MSPSAEQPEQRDPREAPGGAPADRSGADDEPSMAPELSDFLVEFGRLVQKHQVYPVGHPALTQTGLRAAEQAEEALEALGETREMRVTVLRQTLEVEGEGKTRPDNRVCRTVAESLHDRHAAALRVKEGVSEGEMRALGRWLATGEENEEDEAGEDGAERRGPRRRMDRDEVPDPPKLEHLVVELLPYDALRLRRADVPPDDPDAGAEQIWRELAAAVHGAEEAEELAAADLESAAVGDALADRIDDPGVAELVRTMARRVLRRSEPPAGADPGGQSEYAGRLDDVLEQLDDEQLGKLLGGDRATEEDVRALILEAAPHLAPENLERLVRAADDHEYLEISDWLLRVLTKLVRHSSSDGRGVRSVAERQVRRQVRDLVIHYHGDSPHTASYAAALRRMSQPDADPDAHTLSLAPPSSERLLLVGVETDCDADPVLEAWEQHAEGMPLRDRVLWLAESPDGRLTDRLRREVLEQSEEPLRTLLGEQPPAREAAARVIEWSGEAAIEPLMEILAEAERRQVRRFVFDQLGSLGGAVEEYALERLDDDRWYVRRNVLSLLGRVASPPFDLPLERYLEDPHEEVRREAIRLGMQDPDWRERALEAALSDDDRQTLTVGLAAALEGGYPADLTRRIAEIARDDSRSVSVRRRAVRALGRSREPVARKTLLGLARKRRWPFFWQYRLRPGSGVVLEALSALASDWADDPQVGELLQEARSSDDPELRDAAGGTP